MALKTHAELVLQVERNSDLNGRKEKKKFL